MSPKSKEQNKNIKEEKRERILNAALDLFSQKSFYDTTISSIAERAGISKGLVYNYFASKEEILTELVKSGFSRIQYEFLNLPIDPENPEETLKEIFNFMIEIMKEQDSSFFRFGMLINRLEILNFCGDLIRENFLELVILFENLLKKLGSQSPKEDSYIIGSILDGMFYHTIIIGSKYPFDKVKKRLFEFYLSRLEKNFKEENL